MNPNLNVEARSGDPRQGVVYVLREHGKGTRLQVMSSVQARL